MLTEKEIERYGRQIMMFGEKGQELLRDATVLIAGAGGLGSPVAIYLAAAGIGKIRIVDFDSVEESNLNRQILHWDHDIGRMKVKSAREKIEQLNPDIRIETMTARIEENNIMEIVADADIIVDAMDNYDTRFLLNSAAISMGIPMVHGAVHGFHGQITTIVPGDTPCLSCLFPTSPPKELFPIVGATAGVIGTMQANEVIKYLTGSGKLLAGQMLIWNGAEGRTEVITIRPNPACTRCSHLQEK